MSEAKRDRAAETEFREAIEKFLRTVEAMDSDLILTNWVIIATSMSMSDPEISGVARYSSNNTPFWQTGGMLNYAVQRWNKQVQEDEAEVHDDED